MAEGKKFDGGKVRMELIPVGPLRMVGEVLTIGASKYDDRNWEKGIAYSRCYGAMLRHALAWFEGEDRDPEDNQHHLASVCANAMFLMELQTTRPDYDDRPIATKNIPLKTVKPIDMSNKMVGVMPTPVFHLIKKMNAKNPMTKPGCCEGAGNLECSKKPKLKISEVKIPPLRGISVD